jgi:hypothetical protein
MFGRVRACQDIVWPAGTVAGTKTFVKHAIRKLKKEVGAEDEEEDVVLVDDDAGRARRAEPLAEVRDAVRDPYDGLLGAADAARVTGTGEEMDRK